MTENTMARLKNILKELLILIKNSECKNIVCLEIKL